MITVSNSDSTAAPPAWFGGIYLRLRFGDVTSEADAERCNTAAPCLEDIRRALVFFRQAWTASDSRILVSCDYGASRSPALAYVLAADRLGPGREAEALDLIQEIRPGAVPNDLVVRLGDAFLGRDGALFKPLQDLYARINAGLFLKPKQ